MANRGKFDNQDWTEVKIKKRPANKPKPAQAIQAAARSGDPEVVVTKKPVSANKQAKSDFEARVIDREDVEIKTVGPAIGMAIQQGRTAKGLTQKDLAAKIQEKTQLVQQYEAGTAIPNQQILSKMERALGVKLRGVK